MRTLARQFLVAFLVAWLPFCCCQVRAAAAVVAHAGHAGAATTDGCCDEPVREGCCAPARCCDAAPDGAGQGHDRAPARADCCVTCKERALPSTPPAIDVDTFGIVDFAAEAVLAIDDDDSACGRGSRSGPAARDTGPPGSPGGRATLALHSVLVI